MFKGFIFASALLIFTICSPALAQTTKSESITSVDRIQILEGQLSLLNEVNGKILSTIYWALGGLITVFLAIVGLNFFQNFSLNKQRFEALKKQMETQVKEEIEKIETKNIENLSSLSAKVESKVTTEVKVGQQVLESKLQRLKETVNELLRESLIKSAFEHKAKNQLGYLMNLTEVLEMDIRAKSWQIGESLKLVLECLGTCYKEPDALAELQKVLNTVPSEHSVIKSQIEAKMKL